MKIHSELLQISLKTESCISLLWITKSYTTALCYWNILQVPCIVMVEEVDNNNLYIAVSSPDLNFNITRDLEVGSQVNGDERFYSISMPVEIQVMQTSLT